MKYIVIPFLFSTLALCGCAKDPNVIKPTDKKDSIVEESPAPPVAVVHKDKGKLSGADQAGKPEEAKSKASAAPDFDLLGFRECMPVRHTPQKYEETKEKIPGAWIGPMKEEKAREILFWHSLRTFYEYERFYLRLEQLHEELLNETKRQRPVLALDVLREKMKKLRKKWLLLSLDKIRQAADRYPDHKRIDELISLLGEALWWAGKEKEALEVLRGLIKNHPESKELPRAYMFFGEYYLKKGELDKAREAFEKAAATAKNDHDCAPCAAYRIAHCYRLSGDTWKAIKWFERAASIGFRCAADPVK